MHLADRANLTPLFSAITNVKGSCRSARAFLQRAAKHYPMSDPNPEPHQHSHGPANYNKAFGFGVALNVLYILLEIVFGLLSGSLALLADAGHNLSDVLGLLISWGAHAVAQSPPTNRRTYGLRRASILAALANGLILLVAIGAIVWEAIHRLISPQPAAGMTIVWIAGVGVLINAATAWLFMSGRKGDLNIRSAFVHMAADAGVSLGVVVAGVAIKLTGREWIDPAVSLLVAAVIAIGTWSLLRDAVALSLDWVPQEIDTGQVHGYLRDLPGVQRVHDLHIWPLSTTETALTAHLVKANAAIDDGFLARISEELHDRFGIAHTTIQLEQGDSDCPTDQCGSGTV